MFDRGFKLFIKVIVCIGENDLFDEFMVIMFVKVKVEFGFESDIEVIYDFEMFFNRRFKVLV